MRIEARKYSVSFLARQEIFWGGRVGFSLCFGLGLGSAEFCFWKYKRFLLRKYKESFPLRENIRIFLILDQERKGI